MQQRRSALAAWLSRLSAEKAAVYEPSVQKLETGYDLLSVALNEGLQLREAGDLWGARVSASLCGELAERHASLLGRALGTMERRSRHFGMLPEVQPLDEDTFRTGQARSSCFWNGLLHRVLFSARSRWFHKLETLQKILGELHGTFCRTAGEPADGASLSPLADWETLERAHDDWNTCLRETTVLLKCLLTTLAPGEVEELKRELGEQFEQQGQAEATRPSEWLGAEENSGNTSQPEGRPYR